MAERSFYIGQRIIYTGLAEPQHGEIDAIRKQRMTNAPDSAPVTHYQLLLDRYPHQLIEARAHDLEPE